MRELDEAQSQQAQLRDQVAVACNERDEHQAAVAGQAKVIAGLQNQLDALSKQFDDIQEQLAQRDLDNSDLAELIQERESEVQNRDPYT